MKIAIIHLTDMHFTVHTNYDNKLGSLCSAINDHIYGINNIWLVISGDLANTGDKAEYRIISKFIRSIITLLKRANTQLNCEIVLVPGNHDCNFKYDTHARRTLLASIDYRTIGKDESVTDACLVVQNDFWDFYREFNQMPSNKLLYTQQFTIGEKTICFHCINSSWMSKKDEIPGTLFYPVEIFKSYTANRNSDFNIAIWHHPLNWFNPNTKENNKNEFNSFVSRISNIQLIGHEHQKSIIRKDDLISSKSIHLLSGQVFNDENDKDKSGFQCIIVDIDNYEVSTKIWSWKDDHFITENDIILNVSNTDEKIFTIKKTFSNSINEIQIPLTISEKKSLKLDEIFVFPDVETTTPTDDDDFENYFDSANFIKNDTKYAFLVGESQIGKSSLLLMFFRRFYKENLFPLLIKGSEIKDVDLNKSLRRAFSQQYEEKDFDKYLQLDKEEKILLIDDFHLSHFNLKTNQLILEEAVAKFGNVYITVDSTFNMMPICSGSLDEVKSFMIKPLGYKKRHELIEKYNKLKINGSTIEEQEYQDLVKNAFNDVQNILGDKLLPSYPIYILSILQALDYKPLNLNETSYAYCYQSLIFYSLHKAGIENEDFDSYLNFLSELAYRFIIDDSDDISILEFEKFYLKYKERYIIPNYDKVFKTLKVSKIILEDDSYIKFGYKYILYYLSAKKIAEIINIKEGKSIVEKLFTKVHLEKNANILVFITHHTKDISFIEQSIFNSMEVLENATPITLEKNDAFYIAIENLVKNMSNDILDMNRNPKNEREKQLAIKDKLERVDEKQNEDSLQETSEAIKNFHQSFRSIEILGQIIKNRKGSLEIAQLTDMVCELYLTGFRTISYLSKMFLEAKEDILQALTNEIEEGDSRVAIEEKISQFFLFISFHSCIGVLVKLMHSVGHKDLRKIFNEVSLKINSPVAKILSFSINSYYSSFSFDELKALAIELEGNVVGSKILRARAKAYVYNRNPDYKVKQKIADTLKMNIKPMVKHSKNTR